MNNLFQNNYESENDKRLDKKFSYNYQVIKNMYPKASELPEEEVRKIIQKYYQAPQGQEEQVIKNYISQKEPEWQTKYFDEDDDLSKQSHNFDSMKIIDKAFSYLPEYKTLKDAKNEMDRMNMAGYDNYAHRLGMCRIGQMGDMNFLSPTVGVTLGALKEVKDIYDKSIKNNKPWKNILNDSYKDMKNNWEGLNWGLNNPDKDCRIC